MIDGKIHCSFLGDSRRWTHEQFIKMDNPKLQTSITELTGIQPPVRTKQLKIFGNFHCELDDTLALFCYDMVNPTRRQIEDDMHRYQMRKYDRSTGLDAFI